MPRSDTRTPIELLTDKVDEVRIDRADARANFSYTAVATLHRLEVEIIKDVWEMARTEAEEARRAEAEATRAMSEEQLIAVLVEQMGSLPTKMRARVLRRLSVPTEQ